MKPRSNVADVDVPPAPHYEFEDVTLEQQKTMERICREAEAAAIKQSSPSKPKVRSCAVDSLAA